MKKRWLVVGLAFLLGLFTWVLDAFLLSLSFPEESLITFLYHDLTPVALFFRAFVILLFVAFGVLAYALMSREAIVRQKLRRMNAAYDLLSDCNQYIVRARDKEKLCLDIGKEIAGSKLYNFAWVELFEPQKKNCLIGPFSAPEAAQVVERIPAGCRLHHPDSPARQAFQNRNKVILTKNEADRLPPELTEIFSPEDGVFSFLPLAAGEDVVGILAVYRPGEAAEDFDDLHLLEELAGDLAFGLNSIERRELHRQTCRQLEEKEQNMSLLLSNLPGMAYRCANDLDWTMEFVSEGAQELTGYEPEAIIDNREVAYGKLIVPEDREYVWETIQAALDEGRNFEIEYRIQTKSGEQRWVWEQGRGLFDERGELKNIQGFITDVTERKQMEFEVRESEERFRAVIENLPFAVYLHDLSGDIVMVNKMSCEDTGYSAEELLSMSVSDIDTQGPTAADRKELWHELEPGDYRQFMSEHRGAGGRVYSVEITVTPIHLEGERMILAMAEDISEREQIQAERRKSEERYRRLFETSPHGILIVESTTGRLLDVNPYALELFDQKREDLQGRDVKEISVLTKIFKQVGGLEELRQQGYFREEGLTLNKEGSKQIFLELDAYCYEAGGEEVIQCNFRNITRREKAQRELEKLVDEKEILLREIHHRVKNNLFTIVSLLEMQYTKTENSRVRKSFQEAINRIHTMALIHKQIYSQESDQHLDFAAYLRVLVNQLITSQVANDQELDVNFSLESLHLDMDRALPCALAVNELITNAINHGLGGSHRGRLSVELLRRPQKVELNVYDDGSGLPEDFNIERHSSLGLRMVKRWVEDQLRGELDYQSNARTRFTIRFPLQFSER